ncbi:Hypothetical predicted protein [Cloeon dipterum]|uniref:Cep192/Spd-2-like domain-containing protein n=2 Tax=Cloeon dipterum TaxID=197152 RepID=A0A8S1C046_9INSE|nr:Hypothetical predicted protein [Cloeon dipterum]
MALRASSSPNKDGMHTPVKSESLNKNSLNILRRNILTSTALRPRAVSHTGLGLNDTDISAINSPSHPIRISRELDSFLQTGPKSTCQRIIAQEADQIDGKLKGLNQTPNLELAMSQNRHSKLDFSNLESNDLSSLGILRQSEMISAFGRSGDKCKDDVENKPLNNIFTNQPSKEMAPSFKSADVNSSFDLSHFLSSSQRCSPMRPNSLPATKFNNSEFQPADSSVVRNMFKRDEEEFKKFLMPFGSEMEPSLTFSSPCVDVRESWVSPEKRAEMAGKRLTIGQYFKLKSSDLKELSHSFGKSESPEKTPTTQVLPTGAKFQGFNETIDLTDANKTRCTVALNDTIDESFKNTITLDNTTLPCIQALSISTIATLMDDKKGSDTVVRELLDLANKNTSPKKPGQTASEAVNVSPRKAASRLPRPQSKLLMSTKTPTIQQNSRGTGHLVCCDIKIRGSKVVANPCTVTVTAMNESADTLQCDLIDLADCSSYSITNQTPVMLLSKRKSPLQATITFHQAGAVDVNIGVKSMEIRSKRKSTTAAEPLKLFIEPQIYLKTLYKDGISFGLQAEESKATSTFEIVNLSPCDVPICISIEQDIVDATFFLIVPPEEHGGSIRYSTSLAFTLPGSEERSNATIEIGVIFMAPSLIKIPGHMVENEGNCATLRAQLVVEVEKHGEVQGLVSHEKTVLARRPIEGTVGLTQLLVSKNFITLNPGLMQKLAVKNAGVVPLALKIVPMRREDEGSQIENSVQVDPPSVFLLPGEDKPVNVLWLADPENAINFSCYLHLVYANDVADHVVTIECKEKPPAVRERLPLRTTRPHVAWGSIRPGDTSKQIVSFQNTGSEALDIAFRTTRNDHDEPFKILSEKDEVTTDLEVHFAPQQKRNITVMFSPTRFGPAVADIQMLAKSQMFQHKVIPLSGFGGHSKIALRQVSTSKGNKWITLKPDFGDAVVGNFNLYNEGTITAFVKITGSLSIPSTESMTLVCSPDLLFVPPKEIVNISVKLGGVKNVLGRTPASEIKTLAALHISSINEVTRRRLRRVIPTLSNKDLINFLKTEHGAGMNRLVTHKLTNEKDLLKEETLDELNDFSGASASFLTKDLDVENIELRAEGIGAARTLQELDTISSFVSMIDKAVDDNEASSSDSDLNIRGWDVDLKEITLQADNNYKAAVQVTNFTDKPQSLEIVCGEGLEVEPTHPTLAGYKTALIFISYNQETHFHVLMDCQVTVYSKNDRVPIYVRVLPKPRHRVVDSYRKPSESSVASSASSGIPPSPSKSMASDADMNGSSGLADEYRPIDFYRVYADTDNIIFPYTPKGLESIITVTLFNSFAIDKTAKILPPGEPFWIQQGPFVIPAKWHKYIRVYFRPTIARDVAGSLKIKVDGQEEKIVIELQGLTDNH